MKTEIKILKEFIQNKEPRTIRELSKRIRSDYKITYIATQKLIEKNILYTKKIGKSTLCSMNEKNITIEIIEAEYEQRENILKIKNITQMYKEITTKIKTSLFVMVLFGSYVKGTQTRTSDIDILFISNDPLFESKITSIISIIPLKIHPVIVTEEEFIRMKDSKKSNIIQEVLNNNIILYGIETYYHLKNA